MRTTEVPRPRTIVIDDAGVVDVAGGRAVRATTATPGAASGGAASVDVDPGEAGVAWADAGAAADPPPAAAAEDAGAAAGACVGAGAAAAAGAGADVAASRAGRSESGST